MKPPPRIRNKPNRSLEHNPETRDKPLTTWKRTEQKKLLIALKTLSRKTTQHGDIDYSFLKKAVSTRSISEIRCVVEYLKKKLIGSVNHKLRGKLLQDKKVRKPIEVWTYMASAVAGTLEEPISAAFSQMLLISSTEPRTLRNCDPPQVLRLSTDADGPIDRVVPCSSPARGESPGTGTAQPNMLFKTPAPTIGPAKRLSVPFRVVRVSNGIKNSPAEAGTSPAAACSSPNSVKQSPQESLSTLKSTPSSPRTPLSSSSAGTSVSQLAALTTPPSGSSSVSTTSSSSSFTSSVPTLSPSAAASRAKSSSSSTRAEEDKSLVDFEKIYRYLSFIHKPDQECHLTPMESAIILNLMMSLPEELRLLDCNKLHQHLVQTHQCLTSPDKSKMTRKDPKGGLSARKRQPSGRGGAAGGRQQTARVTDGSGDQEDAASQSSGSNSGESQSGEVDRMGVCPPLNPFVVPLKLLMRR